MSYRHEDDDRIVDPKEVESTSGTAFFQYRFDKNVKNLEEKMESE